MDKAKVVEASALEMEITRQFERLGSTSTSISNTITDINVMMFDRHSAVKYVHVERVRRRGRNKVKTAKRLPKREEMKRLWIQNMLKFTENAD